MAINKVINKSTKAHGAMRNVIEYVLQEEKIRQGYVEITGPYAAQTINYDDVYRTWLEEKRNWDKDSGRMYAHNIISFHKDEAITPEKVLEIGREFCEKFFPGFQCLISVHQDKDHLHCHIVTNSVSYIEGHKLHQTRRDLEKQKEFTNSLCLENGLSVAEKGRHFDGSEIEEGQVTAWGKDKYNLLANESKKSFVAECAIAILESVPLSKSREQFIILMKDKGWTVKWDDNRKHIVFQNSNGEKVRDSNIEKTFSMKVNKEALTSEFERQNEISTGNGSDRSFSSDRESGEGIEREIGACGAAGGTVSTGQDADGPVTEADNRDDRRNTEELIRDLASKERASGEKRNNSIAEREDRDTERERQRIEAERRASEKKRRTEHECVRSHSRSRKHEVSL